MTWMRRAVVPLVALIVMLALAGCSGDDPEPKIAPTPSSPATSASPSEPSPAPERLSPEETVRAWVEARNKALRDGDTTSVEALSAESCETCENQIDPIRKIYADGGHFETDGWQVVSSRLKSRSGPRAAVDTAIKYAAGRTIAETGAEPVTYSVERHIVVFKLTAIRGTWQIQFIGYLS